MEVSTGGVSDACWTAGAGIPTLDGLGPIGDDDHSPAEWIEVSSIADRCGLVAGLVAAVPAAGQSSWHRRGSTSADWA
jgi:glutamate carboxypeptidase